MLRDMAGRRRRWRFPLAIILVLVAALLLFGRGLGWLPGRNADAAEDAAKASPTSPTPRGTGANQPAATVDNTGASGIGIDGLHSQLSVVRAAAQQRDFVDGFAALAQLQGLPLAAADAQLVAEHGTLLRSALKAATAPIVAAVSAGLVPAAQRDLLALLGGNAAAMAPEVRAQLPPQWGDVLRNDVPAGLPAPQPLPSGRTVRARCLDEDVVGRLVEVRPQEVTLRLVQGAGVTFPSVPVTAVAPIDATPAEATEMALAAAAAGQGMLARLWVAFALQAGVPAPGSRLAEVAAQLR
jgi:hypothetical protein